MIFDDVHLCTRKETTSTSRLISVYVPSPSLVDSANGVLLNALSPHDSTHPVAPRGVSKSAPGSQERGFQMWKASRHTWRREGNKPTTLRYEMCTHSDSAVSCHRLDLQQHDAPRPPLCMVLKQMLHQANQESQRLESPSKLNASSVQIRTWCGDCPSLP